MAVRSTLLRANLQSADIDHGFYADHCLAPVQAPASAMAASAAIAAVSARSTRGPSVTGA